MNATLLFPLLGSCLVAAAAAKNPGFDSPYGACAHITRNEPAAKTCQMMREAGLRWVRCDFDWRSVETAPGVWDFSKLDRVVAACEAAGVQPLPILGYSTPWASPAYKHLDKWEEYVRRVISHYGRRIPVVEVWNEPNHAMFWEPPSAKAYSEFLKRTYETVKKIDPSIRVAIGGTAGVPLWFIEEIYRLGGAKWFDIMNIHPYSNPRPPEWELDRDIGELRKLMAKYGDAAKPVWITEVGWSTQQMSFPSAGLILAGLKAARTQASVWRLVYVPVSLEGESSSGGKMARYLEGILPKGSQVEVCRGADLAARLAKGSVDAVVFPFDENYDVEAMDAVVKFVAEGGVLVEFGGMPMWNAYRMSDTGVSRPQGQELGVRDRLRLRIAEKAWWLDRRYPDSVKAKPASAAADLLAKPATAQRFFSGEFLKPGDRLVPILSADINGMEAIAAGVYLFGSDMKGAVIVSGLLGQGAQETVDETHQGIFAARSLGIAFAEGVEKYFWYEFWQNEAEKYNSESHYGLVRSDFTPKSAFEAYRTFIRMRPAGSVQNKVRWKSAKSDVFAPQWTRPDGVAAGMIWKVGSPQMKQVGFSSPDVAFFDVNGRRVHPRREGSAFNVNISSSPIYFLGGELIQKKK